MILKIIAVAAGLFGLTLLAKHHQSGAAAETRKVTPTGQPVNIYAPGPPETTDHDLQMLVLPSAPVSENPPITEASLIATKSAFVDIPVQPATLEPTLYTGRMVPPQTGIDQPAGNTAVPIKGPGQEWALNDIEIYPYAVSGQEGIPQL